MRCCVRFYMWLNITFTEPIFFKNKPKELQGIKDEIGRGEVIVSTELEKLMNQEVREILEAKFEGNRGREKLYRIKQQRRLKGTICKSYLELTDLERKIKLNKLT